MQESLHLNHFELFGLPVSFSIDTAGLADRYREMQRAVHPDRFANAPERERRLSMQRAAQINEAYQTLRSTLQRARYLLRLQGMDFNDERATTVDPAFLMEQMELRDALSELKSASDPMTSLAVIQKSITTRQRQLETEFESLFGNGDAASLQQAIQTVHKLQFMEKLAQEAETLEEDLLDQL